MTIRTEDKVLMGKHWTDYDPMKAMSMANTVRKKEHSSANISRKYPVINHVCVCVCAHCWLPVL